MIRKLVATTLFAASFTSANATTIELVQNGGFEAAIVAPWTLAHTANGTTTTQSVTGFDVDNDGTGLLAAQFQVGRAGTSLGAPEGVRLMQTLVITSQSDLSFSADIAAMNIGQFTNSAGGVFTLVFDGLFIDSFDFGQIGGGATERSTLSGALSNVAVGVYTLELLIERGFTTHNTTPLQFVDDVSVLATSKLTAVVPLPATLPLFAEIFAFFGFMTWRNRSA